MRCYRGIPPRWLRTAAYPRNISSCRCRPENCRRSRRKDRYIWKSLLNWDSCKDRRWMDISQFGHFVFTSPKYEGCKNPNQRSSASPSGIAHECRLHLRPLSGPSPAPNSPSDGQEHLTTFSHTDLGVGIYTVYTMQLSWQPLAALELVRTGQESCFQM